MTNRRARANATANANANATANAKANANANATANANANATAKARARATAGIVEKQVLRGAQDDKRGTRATALQEQRPVQEQRLYKSNGCTRATAL